MIKEKVLLVDDDENALSGYRRQFRKLFPVAIAQSGARGLEILATEGPFAVIVSDLRMPGMDGIEFLAKARASAPDSVRIMLTGYAELQSAMDAVNQGSIFRFLTKPCPPADLGAALAAGIRQYRLITAEKELLEKTLQGAIKVLTDALSVFNPEAMGRSNIVTRLVKDMVRELGWEWTWEYETAAMLSQIGWIALSREVLNKHLKGAKLSRDEAEMVDSCPAIGAELISQIPRLEEVARIVAYQSKRFDGSGLPADDVAGKDIPLGSTLLKVALDFDNLVSQGNTKGRAIQTMKQRRGFYDPDVLATLETVLGAEAKYDTHEVTAEEIKPGMILKEPVLSPDHEKMLINKGYQLDAAMIQYLRNHKRLNGIHEPIRVIVPI